MSIYDIIAKGGDSGQSLSEAYQKEQELTLRRGQLQLDREKTHALLQDLAIERKDKAEAKNILSATAADVQSMGASSPEELQKNYNDLVMDRARATGNQTLLTEFVDNQYKAEENELARQTLDVRRDEMFMRAVSDNLDAELRREEMASREKIAQLKADAEKAKDAAIQGRHVDNIQKAVALPVQKFVQDEKFANTMLASIISNDESLGAWWGGLSDGERKILTGQVQLKMSSQIMQMILAGKEDPASMKDFPTMLVEAFFDMKTEWVRHREGPMGGDKDIELDRTKEESIEDIMKIYLPDK
jgi:hypothetical protein